MTGYHEGGGGASFGDSGGVLITPWATGRIGTGRKRRWDERDVDDYRRGKALAA